MSRERFFSRAEEKIQRERLQTNCDTEEFIGWLDKAVPDSEDTDSVMELANVDTVNVESELVNDDTENIESELTNDDTENIESETVQTHSTEKKSENDANEKEQNQINLETESKMRNPKRNPKRKRKLEEEILSNPLQHKKGRISPIKRVVKKHAKINKTEKSKMKQGIFNKKYKKVMNKIKETCILCNKSLQSYETGEEKEGYIWEKICIDCKKTLSKTTAMEKLKIIVQNKKED